MYKLLIITIGLFLTTLANAQPTNGLICHLELDNDFIDVSGNGINGIANGTYSFVDDRNGNPNSALQIFNSPSVGYVQAVFPVGSNQNDSTFTLSFWYNSTKTQTQTFPQVASMGYGVYSVVQNTAYPDSSQFNFSTQSNTGSYHTINLTLDTNWNHLSFTLNTSGVLKAYVNGNFKGEQTMNSNKLNYTIGGLMLSNFQSNSANNGDMYDDILIYNRDLTPLEIQQVFTGNSSCTVNIPDNNFKNVLIGNLNINTNADTEIQCSEATAYTGAIDIFNENNITDLTGLEAFTNITGLDVSLSGISALDVSLNTNLTWIAASSVNLSALDVSNNTNLDTLIVYITSISNLDVSQNTALKYLKCDQNQLTALDVTNNVNLELLDAQYNQISSIDLSNNNLIETLFLGYNDLTSLDVPNSVVDLRVAMNDITTLDLSQTNADLVWCNNNELTSLNIANGLNSNISNPHFRADNNPNLTCIEVDDAAWSTANWTSVDVTATFSEDCSTLNIAETNSNQISVYPNPANDVLNVVCDAVIEQIAIYDLTGKMILTTTESQVTIDQMPSGIYTIVVTTDEGVHRDQIVKS